MQQQRASRDESTCAYENAADAERMSQYRVSRDGALDPVEFQSKLVDWNYGLCGLE